MARSATRLHMRGTLLGLMGTLVVGLWPDSAAAAGPGRCLEVTSASPAKAAAGTQRGAVLLSATLKLNEGCEFALQAQGPWHALPAAAQITYAELARALEERAGAPLTELPTRLHARRPAGADAKAAPPAEALDLAACSTHLLEAGQGFAARMPFGSRRITVRREVSANGCGAAELELGVRAIEPGDATPALLSQGPWLNRLPIGEPELGLDPGHWALYAIAGKGALGVRIGVVDSASASTPLQAYFAAQRGSPTQATRWLRASWALGRLRLEPMSEAQQESETWTELRGAAAAGQLWLARQGSQDRPAGEVISPLLVDRGGRALALPASEIEARMRARYGDGAASMVASLGDWEGAFDGLSLCLAASYDAGELARVAGAVPADASCVALAGLVAPLSLRGGPALPTGSICVKRSLSVMTASGVEPEPTGQDDCRPLPSGAANEPRAQPLLVAVGDELSHSGTGSAQLFACTQGECSALPPAPQRLALERAGLLEIRYAPSLAEASNPDGLTLLRLGVLDPATDWHPVGLLGRVATLPANRWMALDHDEDAVFSYVPGQQQLDLRLSTTPELAVAWNADPTARTQLGSALPRLERVRGVMPGPLPSALVTLVTLEPTCPTESAQELWSRTDRVEPDALPTGRRFHVHLAQYEGPEAPVRCIARASFVVTAHRQTRGADRLRVGVLGDVRAVAFLTAPAALGVMLPAAYLQWNWGAGFGLDLSGSLTAAVTFDRGALSRAGVALSTAVFWGPEALVPRLFEVGGMLHAAGGTHPDQPIASVYVGLNLSALIDAAGGR